MKSSRADPLRNVRHLVVTALQDPPSVARLRPRDLT